MIVSSAQATQCIALLTRHRGDKGDDCLGCFEVRQFVKIRTQLDRPVYPVFNKALKQVIIDSMFF